MSHRKLSLSVATATSAGLLLVTGCVGDEAPQENVEDAASGDNELRFAHVYDPDHPVESCGVPAINDALEGSGLQVNSYPAGQLGDEQELLEQVQSGSLDLAVAGPSYLGVWEEDAEVFDAAYLFEDIDHFEETVNGPIAEEIWSDLRENTGLDVQGSWYYGTRQVTSNMEVTTSDDLGGTTFRSSEAPLYQTLTEILGGSPTPMALGEVYLGLQQGTIDAQENPIPTIASYNFQEVQDYLNLTHHVIQGVMVVGNDESLSALDDEEQQTLGDAMEAAAADVRDCIEDDEESYIDEWRDSGEIEINDDVDVEHFRERAVDRIPEEFAWGDLYLEIQER